MDRQRSFRVLWFAWIFLKKTYGNRLEECVCARMCVHVHVVCVSVVLVYLVCVCLCQCVVCLSVSMCACVCVCSYTRLKKYIVCIFSMYIECICLSISHTYISSVHTYIVYTIYSLYMHV